MGHYIAELTGDREVVLTIHEDLSFEYIEDSFRRGHVSQVFRKGNVRAVSKHTARVGLVQLEWISPNNIKALSPYGGTRRPSGGNLSGSVGRGGMIWSDGGHVFYLHKR